MLLIDGVMKQIAKVKDAANRIEAGGPSLERVRRVW
jgi:hypothetical protein